MNEGLRHGAFRRYWAAQTVSLFGDQVTLLAMPLLAVLAIGAGPKQMGLLTAAALVPNLLFSLPAGAWVDRRPGKRRLMIVADLGRALLLVTVPVLWWAGWLTLGVLYVVAFGMGTLSVLFEVAHSSLFASLVHRDDYVSAHSRVNGSRALSSVAGPSLGGVLVQMFTAPFALLGDVVTFLGSAALLSRMEVAETKPVPRQGWGLTDGMRFVLGSPVLRATLFSATTLNLFNYIFAALFVLYATTELHISPGLLGLIMGLGAVGGLAGAAIARSVSRKVGIGPALIIGLILFPAPLTLVPLAGEKATGMLFAAEFLSALGVVLLDIVAGSVQTAATPEARLAVVAGFKRTVNYGIRPIGAVLGGTLGAAIGVRPALWVATTGALLGVLWAIFSPLRTMRELPSAGYGEGHNPALRSADVPMARDSKGGLKDLKGAHS